MRGILARLLLPRYGLLVLAAVLLHGCGGPRDSLQQIRERGELRFVTRNGPLSYFEERAGPSGFEYELASRFADHLGVRLHTSTRFLRGDLFQTLQRGEADIGGALLALDAQRAVRFPHSVGYHSKRTQVVYRVGRRRPQTLADLVGLRVLVLAASSHIQLLEQARTSGLPGLRWEVVEDADSLALLQQVDSGAADVALVDAARFSIHQTLLPQLDAAFSLGAERPVVWYLRPDGDNRALERELELFFSALADSGELAALRQRYFAHERALGRVGAQTFLVNVRERLPQYRDLIEQVAAEHQLNWPLLAAIAYQESHWDPGAVSPTGVRGMMMLTGRTAEELGVTDREDALQSLRGGARYLKEMRRRLPARIAEPDRTWLALAAYNIGLAHLEDARVLTQRNGGDPDRWEDVARHLPLLEQADYYRELQHGYARGAEAAHYVRNVRYYQNVLRWQFAFGQREPDAIDIADYLPAALKGLALRAL